MTISQLTKVMQPPINPTENIGDWQAVEEQVGTALPAEYKTFIETYGTGIIGRFIYIWNPFAQEAFVNLTSRNANETNLLNTYISEWDDIERNRLFPFPVFPEKFGVLSFGSTRNGDTLFWRTHGKPDEWSIVVWKIRSARFELHDMSMSRFLYLVLTNKRYNTLLHEANFDPIYGFENI